MGHVGCKGSLNFLLTSEYEITTFQVEISTSEFCTKSRNRIQYHNRDNRDELASIFYGLEVFMKEIFSG